MSPQPPNLAAHGSANGTAQSDETEPTDGDGTQTVIITIIIFAFPEPAPVPETTAPAPDPPSAPTDSSSREQIFYLHKVILYNANILNTNKSNLIIVFF